MSAPDPRDVLEFSFRALQRLQLQPSSGEKAPKSTTQRLASSSKLGKIFAGCLNKLCCVDVSKVEAGNAKDDDIIKVDLPSTPSHVALNADEFTLATCVLKNGLPTIYMFDTRSFLSMQNVKPFLEIPASTPPGTVVRQLCWNPVMPSMLAVVYTNGSLALFMVSEDGRKADSCTLPPADGISCISWSPKGKQLVAGKLNGKLTQYKPDLKEAKTMEGPPGQMSALSIVWLSTYQFVVAYQNKADKDSRPGLFLVQSSKGGPTTYVNYDDICYSVGEDRSPDFMMVHQHDWGVVFCASSNSMELAVLGAKDKEQTSWEQWLTPESGRAELPLMQNNEERFPVGVTLSLSSQKLLPLEENNTLPVPMPILFLLSHDDLLCGFYAVNRLPGAPQITKPMEANIPSNNIRQGTVHVPAAPQQTSFSVPKPTQQQPLLPKVNLESKFDAVATSAEQPKSFFGFAPPPVPPSEGFVASTPIKPLLAQPDKTVAAPNVSVASSKPFSFQPLGQTGTSFSSSQPLAKPTPIVPTSGVSKPGQMGMGAITTTTTTTTTVPPVVAKPVVAEAKEEVKKGPSAQELEAGYQGAIREEILAFEAELAKLKQRASCVKIDIGTHEEKVALKTDCEDMEMFCKELVDITSAQNKEIHALQTATLETFEWTEEARSRDIRNKDPRYQRLLKGRALDPLSQKRLSSVQSKYMYLEQQLNEVNAKLDLEWEDHIHSSATGGPRKRRIEAPSRETIYRALLNNANIRETQKTTIGKLTNEIKELKIRNITTPWNMTSSPVGACNRTMPNVESEMSKLADSLIDKTKLSPDKKDHNTSLDTSSHSVLSPVAGFSPEKESVLRQFFKNKGTTKVKPVKFDGDSSKLVQTVLERQKKAAKPKSKDLIENLKVDDNLKSRMSGTQKSATTTAQTPAFCVAKSLPVQTHPATPSTTLSLSGDTAFASIKPASSAIPSFTGFGGSPASTTGITPPPPSYGSGFGGSKTTAVSSGPTSISSSFGLPSTSETAFKGFGSSVTITPVALTTKPSITATSTTTRPGLLPTSSASTAATTTTASSIASTLASPAFGTVSKSTPVAGDSKSTTTQSAASGEVKKAESSSIFGVSKPASETKPAELVKATTTSTTSIFGSSKPTSAGIFGGEKATTTTTTPASTSMFGATSTASGSTSLFGGGGSSVTSPPIFGGSKTSAFGGAPTTTTSSSTSIFGSSPASSGSIFGTGTSTKATTTTAAVTTTTTTTTTTQSVFGATSTPSTQSGSSSVFGSSSSPAATSTTKSSTTFGGSATPTAAAATTTTTTPATSSIFGSKPVFDSPSSTTTTTTSSIFGGGAAAKPTTTAAGSVFGASSTTSSVFGGTTATSPSTSLFGGAAATTTASSVFGGGSTVSSSPSVFGATTTTTSKSSVFGSAAPSTTSSSSIFGGSAATATTTASSSPFGGGGGAFGSSSTTSSIFGGGGGGFFSGLGAPASDDAAKKNVFGGAGPTAFGAGGPSSSSSIFGGASSSTSPFGGSTAATATTSSSAFGAFNTNASSVSSKGFGVASTQQQPQQPVSSPVKSGFGSPPAFGSRPTFGGSPAFGGGTVSPTSGGFGAGPAFGSAPVFGGTPAFGGGSGTAAATTTFGGGAATNAPTFGSVVQEGGPSFGALAQGGAGGSTFGGLAQQTPPGQPSTFGGFGSTGSTFGGSPSSTGSAFGGGGASAGGSFSSWR